MLSIGSRFPDFSLSASVSASKDDGFVNITQDSFAGKWKVYFFWPKDFTFVCPTEIVGFGDLNSEFADRDTQLIGASIDSDFVHLAWRMHHPDLTRELCTALGILHPEEGAPLRATFIVDENNIIRHVSANDLSVGRNPQEILRILDGLQTDELCPCNWKKGESTL
jgi:peroxiredoxin (alkyl hydroperoxide reductase subunit C)